MRYSFHDQLAAIKKNAKHVLPEDINAPVVLFLEKIGCDGGVDRLKKLQKNVDYGTIDLFRDDVPNAKITIEVNAGMAEGYKQYEVDIVGKWRVVCYKSIRNANLDMKRKQPKDVKNG